LPRRKGSNWSNLTSAYTSNYCSFPSSLSHTLYIPLRQAILVFFSNRNLITIFSLPLKATTLFIPVCRKYKLPSSAILQFLTLWVKSISRIIETTMINISPLLALSTISTKLLRMSSCSIPAKACLQHTEVPKFCNLVKFRSWAPMGLIWSSLIPSWILSFSQILHHWPTIIWWDMRFFRRRTDFWLKIW